VSPTSDTLERALNGALWPLLRLFRMDDPFSAASLAGAAILAVAIVMARRRSSLRAAIGGGFAALVPRRALVHPSAALDVKVYLVNGVLAGGSFGLFTIGAETWRRWTATSLEAALGPSAPSNIGPWIAGAAATLVGIVAFDFGYYVAHWLGHHTALWRFHQKHHGAAVLTPIAGAREHPVDTLVSINCIGFCVGASDAALGFALGPAASPSVLFHTNCVLVVYYLTLQHLRHSELWLAFPAWLGHIIQSPAHHQLHHSASPDHYDKNLGFLLAIFDAAFGTLRVPRPDEGVSEFGLSGAPADESLADFYFQPFGARVSTAASDRRVGDAAIAVGPRAA
jgi:sterol desaturase/sphingolipid hydroxylase (fatty acid hydroxylase superfamily)